MKHWAIFTQDKAKEKQWKSDLTSLSRGLENVFDSFNAIFVDAKHPAWQAGLQQIDRNGKSVVLVTEENDFLPDARDLALIDDIIVYPFRLGELISKVKHASAMEQLEDLKRDVISAHDQVVKSNNTLERILEAKTPKRFQGIRGLNIMSRHLTGLKPGGDYFDVFESEKKEIVNVLLCDSSSYGLSSALLGMILSSSAKIASDVSMNTGDWIRAIFNELKVALGENEHLSVFFGRLNKRDYSFNYQLHGTIEAFIVDKAGDCHPLEKSGSRMSHLHPPGDSFERKVHLNPKDRLVLLSDGFVRGMGGEFYLNKLFREKMNRDPFQLVNELAYQIKSKVTEGETFPGEDCSAIVIDIESNVLRLAPTG
ncbi:MAG: SpoIIE family protein phosphatase [Bdellovibrionales bacterium]|nr:SpoIIE family protein phosphatase [Bdellovibrionales bacterium]